PEEGTAVLRPAADYDLRRPDQEGSDSLFPELRVRALALHAAVHDTVSGLQHQSAGHLHGKEGWRPTRHPVLAEDPLRLSPEPGALVGSVRRALGGRQHDPPFVTELGAE